MEQLLFRHLIPGLFLLLPIYLSILLFGNQLQLSDEVVNVSTAVFTSLIVPAGYIFYQIYRIIWQVMGGGYDKLPFVVMLRNSLKFYNQPHLKRILVDFSNVLPQLGIRWFTYSEFEMTFDPFASQVSKVSLPFGFNSNKNRVKRTNWRKNYFHFLEHVSDVVLFDQPSYGYARSISSARYSTHASTAAFFVGLILASGLFFAALGGLKRDLLISLSITIGIFGVAILLFLLSVRTRYSSAEYNARINLLTILSMGEREIKTTRFEEVLPFELSENLSRIMKHTDRTNIAAFDMDDTLLVGDIGDAVLAQLIFENKLPSSYWLHYATLLKEDKPKAYKYAVTALAGLNVYAVYNATNNLLNSSHSEIFLEDIDVRVPIPKPDPILQSLIIKLQHSGFEVYLVSATNYWTVKIVGAEYYGLPESNIVGMKTKLIPNSSGGEITANLLEPTPMGEGKAIIMKKITDRLTIAAGNSKQDFELLQMVDENGLVIWVGNDTSLVNSLRAFLGDKKNLFVVDR